MQVSASRVPDARQGVKSAGGTTHPQAAVARVREGAYFDAIRVRSICQTMPLASINVDAVRRVNARRVSRDP